MNIADVSYTAVIARISKLCDTHCGRASWQQSGNTLFLRQRQQIADERVGERQTVAHLIQEQTVAGIFDHPVQPIEQVGARHGAARQDRPFVCLDVI